MLFIFLACDYKYYECELQDNLRGGEMGVISVENLNYIWLFPKIGVPPNHRF